MTTTVLLIQDHPSFVAGNWYAALKTNIAVGATITTVNSIRLIPFFIPAAITISDLAINITTGASGGNVQLAIYANDPAINAPTGSPLAKTGSISTTSTGPVSASISGGNVPLLSGWYWMAIVADTTAAPTAVFESPSTAAITMSYWMGDATLASIFPAGGATGLLRYTIANSGAFGTWPDLTGQAFSRSNAAGCALLAYKVVSSP